jgi:hypothetical protein
MTISAHTRAQIASRDYEEVTMGAVILQFPSKPRVTRSSIPIPPTPWENKIGVASDPRDPAKIAELIELGIRDAAPSMDGKLLDYIVTRGKEIAADNAQRRTSPFNLVYEIRVFLAQVGIKL